MTGEGGSDSRSWYLNNLACPNFSFQCFCMIPKARPRDTISSEYAFARFLLTRSATTPACRLSIVLTILGTGKYRYRWNVAPLNNISSQDFSFRIFFPKPARALLSNAPRIIKIGSLVQFRHPKEFIDPPSARSFNILVHITSTVLDLITKRKEPGFEEISSIEC